MNDWKKITEGHGIPVSSAEMNRMVATLKGLEEALEPILKKLPAGPLMALSFNPVADGE